MRLSSLPASLPDAFKSWLSRERRFHSAHVKVDYDRAPRWRFLAYTSVWPDPGAEEYRPVHAREDRMRKVLERVPGNPLRARDLRALRAEADRRGLRFARVLVHATRKGHHLRCWIAGVPRGAFPPARAVLALQAAAGDDPVRQRFNRGRVRRGEAGWNVLFTSKHRSGKRIMEEAIDVRWTAIARRILTS